MNKAFFTNTLFFLLSIFIPLLLSGKDIPITMVGRLLGIEAEVNGMEGLLLLDTGAEGLALNKKYFSGTKSRTMIAHAANESNIPVEIKYVNFEIGAIHWRKKMAYILPLAFLEKRKKIKVLGLIGTNLFRKYSLTIDLDRMKMRIQKASKSKNRKKKYLKVPSKQIVLPFRMKGSMPWFTAHIDGQPYKFGLDTGAESNFMNNKRWHALKRHLKHKRQGLYRSVANRITKTSRAQLHDVKFGSLHCFPMNTLSIDMQIINSNFVGKKLDGILGYEFLQQFFEITFDFQNREILLWQYEQERQMVVAHKKRISDLSE